MYLIDDCALRGEVRGREVMCFLPRRGKLGGDVVGEAPRAVHWRSRHVALVSDLFIIMELNQVRTGQRASSSCGYNYKSGHVGEGARHVFHHDSNLKVTS